MKKVRKKKSSGKKAKQRVVSLDAQDMRDIFTVKAALAALTGLCASRSNWPLPTLHAEASNIASTAYQIGRHMADSLAVGVAGAPVGKKIKGD